MENFLRVKKKELVENFTLKISAISENKNLNHKATNVKESKSKFTITQSETLIRVIEPPALPSQQLNSKPRIIIAGAGFTEQWDGCVIFSSYEENSGYKELGRQSVRSSIGTALNPLNSVPSQFRDNISKLKVNLVSGELYSIKEEDFLRGENLALIGSELIYFKNAKLLSPFSYELSGFIRGRQGTENAISSHVEGEDFTLLGEGISTFEFNSQDIGKKLYIKALSFGQTLANTRPQEIVLNGNSLKPFSVVNLQCKDLGSSWHFSWTRRNNIDGELRNNIDIPMHEPEQYLCELFTKNDKHIATIQTSKPHLLIMKKDYPVALTKIIVSQLSNNVGRGFANEINL